ncbi:MAG: DUF2442 domain-containing protein [Deltaproteobacteria bacterium]|nr:DUF2442 domain-containing protein [Deltaproteobacteria bacterium]
MIELIDVQVIGEFQLRLEFSDGSHGNFDGRPLLQRQGSLLQPLRDRDYFSRCFIDAGGLAWPNGLELSPATLHSMLRDSDCLRGGPRAA